MNYSNPIIRWIDGSNNEGFTYDHGEHPFHLFIHTGSWIPLSIMVFANNEDHALIIFKDLIKWCKKAKNYKSKDLYKPSKNYLKEYERAVRNKTLQITRINKNQCFKIGWAGNDTYISL